MADVTWQNSDDTLVLEKPRRNRLMFAVGGATGVAGVGASFASSLVTLAAIASRVVLMPTRVPPMARIMPISAGVS